MDCFSLDLLTTWGKPHTITHFNISGYSHVYDIRTDKIGGGCSLYINEKVSFKIRKDLKLGESVFIEIDKNVFKYTKNIILGVIYRSPDSQFSTAILKIYYCKVDSENKLAFLSGDYNVNTSDKLLHKSTATHDFINAFSLFRYYKLFTQPTRIIMNQSSIKSATLIDNIYTNFIDWKNGLRGILHSDEIIGNDQKSIFVILSMFCALKSPQFRTRRVLA